MPHPVEANLPTLAKTRSRTFVELRAEAIDLLAFGDEEVEEVAQLAPLLKEAARKIGNDDPTRTVMLVVEGARPWSDVVAVANAAAAAGFDQLDFVFQRSTKIAAPSPAAAREWSAIIKKDDDPSMRQRSAAELFYKTFDPCRPGQQVLGHVAGVDYDQKMPVFVSELPTALRACNCAVAPRDAMALMWMLDGPDADGTIHRNYIGARLKLSKAGKPATAVRAKKATPWSEAFSTVAKASEAGAGVRLEVSGR